MPYRTIWEPRGILWVYEGDVTAQEIEDANGEFYADARSDDVEYQIIDASRVTNVEWSDRDIAVVAAHDIGAEQVIKNVRVAFVATDAEIMSRIEKYMDIARRMTPSWDFHGFSDLAEARRWAEGG